MYAIFYKIFVLILVEMDVVLLESYKSYLK